MYRNSQTPNKELRKEASRIVREMKKHFKKDGWPLRYSFYKDDLFYAVFGHHLENYLLRALARSNMALQIASETHPLNSDLFIRKLK